MRTQTHDTQTQTPPFVTKQDKELDFWATVTDEELAFWSSYKIQGLGKYYTEFEAE
jgi:hypothetical protein